MVTLVRKPDVTGAVVGDFWVSWVNQRLVVRPEPDAEAAAGSKAGQSGF